MSFVILDNIPLQFDRPALRERLRVKEGGSYADAFERMVNNAQGLGRPKALYTVSLIDEKGDDYVILDRVRFNSRVLRVNLDAVHRVFAYVATCGT